MRKCIWYSAFTALTFLLGLGARYTVLESPVLAEQNDAGTVKVAPAAAPTAGSASAAATGSPAPATTPTAKLDPVSACKKAVVALRSGDVAPLEALPADARIHLFEGGNVNEIITCFCAADDNSKVCGSLPVEAEQKRCVDELQFVRKVKALKTGSSALSVAIGAIYEQCKTQLSDQQCDILKTALTAKDASKCSTLPGVWKNGCEGLVTGDPGRCPAADKECHSLVKSFPKSEQEASNAWNAWKTSPIGKAATTGKRKECAPLVADLERHCTE